ncbi:TPA: hypothetical protein ACPZHQ_003849 [Yersinia enterocolitica]
MTTVNIYTDTSKIKEIENSFVHEDERYNERNPQTRIEFKIEPYSHREIFYIKTPIIPEQRKPVEISNSGLADNVTAKYMWSHFFTPDWKVYSSIDIASGETKILSAPSNSVYYSKVIIYNNTDKPGFITAHLK